jgi:hypothetical protein
MRKDRERKREVVETTRQWTRGRTTWEAAPYDGGGGGARGREWLDCREHAAREEDMASVGAASGRGVRATPNARAGIEKHASA